MSTAPPAFYLVMTPTLIWEQPPALTLADAIETCWAIEEPDMRVLCVDGARVTDVTFDAAIWFSNYTFNERFEPQSWLASFLEAEGLSYYVEDEDAPRRGRYGRDSNSTLNHTQQGI